MEDEAVEPVEDAEAVREEAVEEAALEGVFTFVDGSRYEGQYSLVEGARVRSGTGTMIQGPEVRAFASSPSRARASAPHRSKNAARARHRRRARASGRRTSCTAAANARSPRERRTTRAAGALPILYARARAVCSSLSHARAGRLHRRQVRGRGRVPLARRPGSRVSPSVRRRSLPTRRPDGAVYRGGWRENKMHGEGCYTDTDKVNWKGPFHNGKFYNGKAYATLR